MAKATTKHETDASPKGKRPGQVDVQTVGRRLPATSDKHQVGKVIEAKIPVVKHKTKRTK